MTNDTDGKRRCEAYAALFRTELDAETIGMIRIATHRGQALGNDRFSPFVPLLFLIRASETWRRVVISEFELKQLEQLREHLNRLHAERTAPAVKNAFRSQISSNERRGPQLDRTEVQVQE